MRVHEGTLVLEQPRFRLGVVGKFLIVLGALVVLSVLFAPFAHAEGDVVQPREGAVFSIDLGLWTMVQSYIVPLVVGLVLKATATTGLKVVTNIVVNAVGSLLASVVILDGVATISKATIMVWLLSTIGAIAAHYGFWKPLNVTGSTDATNKLIPTLGF